MKKVLSVILSLSMLLSLMGTMGLQASAMGENEGYPLLYETYESDSALNAFNRGGSGAGTITIQDGGLNGSQGALAVCQTSGKNYIDIQYPTTYPIVKGEQLDISFWVKLKSDLKTDVADANQVSLIFYGHGIVSNVGNKTGIQVGDVWNTSTGWKQYNYTNKMVKDQWVKISQTITWEDTMSIGSNATINNISLVSVALRVANQNGTNAVVDGANLAYEVDDFVISNPAPAQAAGKLNVREDFNNSNVNGTTLDGRSEDCSLGYHKVVYAASAVDASAGHIVNKQANYNPQSTYTTYGHMYKISGWFRYDADDTATDFVANKACLRLIFYNKDRNDPNFEKPNNYPSFYSKSFPEGQWTYLEYYYYMDYRAYTKNPGNYLGFRICPIASYQGGAEKAHTDHTIPGTFGFDNIKVQELGAPANGNMEVDPSIPVIYNFKEVTQTVPGWLEGNATMERVTENGNTFLKMTGTSDQHGHVMTPYAFENGKKYRISFRAKLDNLADGESQALGLILDRRVDSVGSADAYNVPSYEYLIGGNKLGSASGPGANAPWQATNEWKTFTTVYAPNFTVKSGMEEAATNVNPRCANTYLYTYAADGKVSPKGTVLSLDDFVIEELPTPTAENISFVRENSAIRVNYEFIPAASEKENKNATLIRAFLKNGETETNIGTFSGAETFEVPSIAAGKTIYFEITPVDENGNIGNAATKACDIVFDYVATRSMQVSADKKTVTWNMSACDTKNLIANYRVGVVAYAEDDSMLGADFESYSASEGKISVNDTFSIPQGATHVKMFVWDTNANAPVFVALEEALVAE